MQARPVEAHGAASPDEHLGRIDALRVIVDDEDGRVPFMTRSRVVEAAQRLVDTMVF